MTWEDIRRLCPKNWVLVEAIGAFTEGPQRVIPELHFLQAFGSDWNSAWQEYKRLHRSDKWREYYVLHTDREELNIGVIDSFWRVVQ